MPVYTSATVTAIANGDLTRDAALQLAGTKLQTAMTALWEALDIVDATGGERDVKSIMLIIDMVGNQFSINEDGVAKAYAGRT